MWFCTDYCQFWEIRDDATAVHGWCRKYHRFVMHTDICGCPPEDRIDNKAMHTDDEKPENVGRDYVFKNHFINSRRR